MPPREWVSRFLEGLRGGTGATADPRLYRVNLHGLPGRPIENPEIVEPDGHSPLARPLLSRARFRFQLCPKIEKCKPYSGLPLNCNPITGFVKFCDNPFKDETVYLFEGQKGEKYASRSIQEILKASLKKTSITKPCTLHTLKQEGVHHASPGTRHRPTLHSILAWPRKH